MPMPAPTQQEVEDMFSHEYSHTMAKVLLLTNSQGASAEVLPALGLLQHTCKVAPLEASVLVDTPVMDVVFIDARRDFPTAKSLTRLLATTGVGAPIIAITTEGGLTAFTAEWGFNDVILDTAGPAEIDARIRIAVGAHAAQMDSQDPTSSEIRQGDVVIDENTYTAKIKGTALDLTFKEFELLKYLAQHPGRVFTRAQLLQEIWGYDYFGGTRTVDVHIRRLRSKLGPEFESIIGTVRNVGYRFTVQNGGKENASYELV
jgi:DNA-binding response OmpR family regulator